MGSFNSILFETGLHEMKEYANLVILILRKRFIMKKVKQILAILGIVLILGMNFFLVFAAGTASEDGMGMFGGAVVTVIMVPVLLWIYLYIYKMIKKRNEEKEIEEELDK